MRKEFGMQIAVYFGKPLNVNLGCLCIVRRRTDTQTRLSHHDIHRALAFSIRVIFFFPETSSPRGESSPEAV